MYYNHKELNLSHIFHLNSSFLSSGSLPNIALILIFLPSPCSSSSAGSSPPSPASSSGVSLDSSSGVPSFGSSPSRGSLPSSAFLISLISSTLIPMILAHDNIAFSAVDKILLPF